LRNTLRYLLGALEGFSEAERLPVEQMPELERWVLHRVALIDAQIRKSCNDLVFHGLFTELHTFCAVDLSAFYFDIRKDALYCDAPDSIRRRAARTVMDTLFSCLTAWLAPFICFTAEEAWLARNPGDDESVHLRTFPEIPAAWSDAALAAKWDKIRDVRRVITGALEIERAAKRIGSSLQAAPTVYVGEQYKPMLDGADLAEIAITSGVTLLYAPAPEKAFRLDDVAEVGVVPGTADGAKCQRCWKVLPEVGSHAHEGVCGRCSDAVAAQGA
jgi:isoleucyl-tRNA synthetase